MDRIESLAGWFARKGINDPEQATAMVANWDEALRQPVLDQIACAADPNLAFITLSRILESRSELLEQLVNNPSWLERLICVIGASAGLGNHLVTHPQAVDILAADISARSASELCMELLAAVGVADAATVVTMTNAATVVTITNAATVVDAVNVADAGSDIGESYLRPVTDVATAATTANAAARANVVTTANVVDSPDSTSEEIDEAPGEPGSTLEASNSTLEEMDATPCESNSIPQEAEITPDEAVASPQDTVSSQLAELPVAAAQRANDLRLAYHNALLRIAARDLQAAEPKQILTEIVTELSDLATAVVETALALARSQTQGWEKCRLGIVALGKAGARELNYVSDVDVLYVAEPALDATGSPLCEPDEAISIATNLVGALSRITSAHTSAGTIWPLDPNLRPEGKNGPLVRSLASHRAYYEKWAKNWEFQAMLKARPMAGDLELAQDFVDMVWPMVWKVADDPNFVPEVQAMRKRVISLLDTDDADREIKLGSGGLRDVEFSVQLLQLVHGRTDERLRLRGTFPALEQLVAHGYVGRADGAALDDEYCFQRVLEHRTQLYKLRRTHLLPQDAGDLRRLSRSLKVAENELENLWRASARRVRTLRQKVFYSPVLEAVARIPGVEVRLTSEAAETRLQAIGYADPQAALRHIEALSTGMSRRAEIQRQLLPAMLGWFAAGPNPDHGLLAFRQVSEALGSTPWYLRALRDGDATSERFAKILASSRYAVDLLLRNPQGAAFLSQNAGLEPRPAASILQEMQASLRRHDSESQAMAAIRAVRRSELLRLAMGDLLATIGSEQLGQALSDVTRATIEAGLEVATRGVAGLPRLAVIAMGRWGGQELSYASDADAIFVVDDTATAEDIKAATDVVSGLRKLLSQPGPDPALEIDVDLRPEGKAGAMVRTLSSYTAYYQRWSSTWEMQALLRARPGAGDAELGAEFIAMIDPIRYPAAGLEPAQIAEIRKLKARMEAERLPRGSDPARNTKLGPGGLSDVEWVVQLLQLEMAGSEPLLRFTNTLDALDALEAVSAISGKDAAMLRDSWLLASRIRNAIMLLRGRATDAIPTDPREVAALATVLGYPKAEASVFLDNHLRRARHAREVMDRIFWGVE